MNTPTTPITGDTYQKVLALATSANDLYVRARQFEFTIPRELRTDDRYAPDWIAQIIFNDERFSVTEFDEALQKDGFVVLDPPPSEAVWKSRFMLRFVQKLEHGGYAGDEDSKLQIANQHANASYGVCDPDDTPEQCADGEYDALADATR